MNRPDAAKRAFAHTATIVVTIVHAARWGMHLSGV
jgi:hypothetical protein